MFGNGKYILYNKDNPILKFHSEWSDNKPVFFVDQILSDKPPLGFSDINLWLNNRRAPEHREHIKELLTKCNCYNMEGYIHFSYCAGLNDTFWVKPEEKTLSWNNISLYKNDFDENIARIAFDGGLMGEKFSSATPELATDGTFPKCWKRYENGIYLLKQGSSGAANAGREPFSELYAYKIAKEVCDNPVPYEIIKHYGKIAAKCPLFSSEEYGYVPIVNVLGLEPSFNDILKFYDSIGSGNEFRQMIVLDALTLNTDRHLRNFGIMFNNDTLEIIGMAPVFDNNLSLCPYADNEDLKNIETYIQTRKSAFREGFNETALMCMTPKIRSDLKNLKCFEFNRQEKYHLSEERLALLSNMVRYQIDNLLNERLISTSYEPQYTDINALTISVLSENIDDKTLNVLKKEDAEIKRLQVSTKNGTDINIRNLKYVCFSEKKHVCFDAFNFDYFEKTMDTEFVSAKSFYFLHDDITTPVCFKGDIEIQIGKTDKNGKYVDGFFNFQDIPIFVLNQKVKKKIEEIFQNINSDEYEKYKENIVTKLASLNICSEQFACMYTEEKIKENKENKKEIKIKENKKEIKIKENKKEIKIKENVKEENLEK